MSRPIVSSLPSHFSAHLGRLGLRHGNALVAVSGGVDSTVLLHLVHAVANEHQLKLIVAHLDHGIHSESRRVALRVEALARDLHLPFVSGRLELGQDASETMARVARTKWLEEARRRVRANYIFLAHQADDQAETVLMRLLRGSGPAGLAGMPPRRGVLVRPLLSLSRQTILGYARANRLDWWEDPANQNPHHLRSWIRSDVLPQLTRRLPDVGPRIRAAGRHAGLNRRAWSQALKTWPGLEYRQEAEIVSVNWLALSDLPVSLQIVLLQTLARRAGIHPGPKRISAALRMLQSGQSGALADLGGGWSLERAFDRVRVLPGSEESRADGVAIAGLSGELKWGPFQLRWSAEQAPRVQPRDGDTAWFIPGTLVVRSWQAGDRLSPLGGRGRRLAVRCFQDARVPSSERRRWPMLVGAGELAWIPGVCRSDRLVPVAGAPALRVDVERHG